jgi:hypothetical protein
VITFNKVLFAAFVALEGCLDGWMGCGCGFRQFGIVFVHNIMAVFPAHAVDRINLQNNGCKISHPIEMRVAAIN